MAFVKFLHKPKNELEHGGRRGLDAQADENERTLQCPNCHRQIPQSELWERNNTCSCGFHLRMNARARIRMIVDDGTFMEHDASLCATDALQFPGYAKKLDTTRRACGEKEAVVCGEGKICGNPCCIFVMESLFMMGSMGSAVGEKITRLFEYAAQRQLPVVGFTVSGGARMQEGLLSLMQMAKTSAAVQMHSSQGLLYLVVLTDPTTGGVTASFAMEADVILAEPGALIGFAGPRVIEQTMRKKLPDGFQKAEFLLEHGFVDAIVPRMRQKQTIAKLLAMHQEVSV